MTRACLLLALLLIVPVFAAPSADEAALRAQYAIYSNAYKTKHVQDIMNLTTPDYTSKIGNGKVLQRDEFEHVMESQVKTATSEALNVDHVTVRGNSATTVIRETVVNDLKSPLTDEKAIVQSTCMCREQWVRTPAGWRLKHSETLSESYLLNGKPFKP
ncbi:MAG: nuclear transport factor 2 family protein [Candidatus Xenobia bacterium]